MTLGEIKRLIATGEREALELKATTGQRIEGCRTLCALLNGAGGTVVFGVTDDGVVKGQLVSDKTRRELSDCLSKIEPFPDVAVEWIDVDAVHKAIVCTVERGNMRPYTYDGRAYKRVQSTTREMSRDEYHAAVRTAQGFQSQWEKMPNPNLTLNDIDLEEVRSTARRAINAGRLDSSVDAEDALALLDRFKMRANGVLLNGAAVLFGKPDLFDYSQLQLKMGWFRGTDMEEFLDNRHVFGNVSKLMDEAMAFCFKHLNYSAKVKGIEREEELEIPAPALREALINAFAHRSYESRGMTVYLAVFADRVEIKNPGSFPPEWDVGSLFTGERKASMPKNPDIAHVLYLRKSIESWGRGLELIGEEMRRVGMPLPIVEVRYGYVVTTFRRPQIDPMKGRLPHSSASPLLSGSLSGSGDPERGQKRDRSGLKKNEGLAARLLRIIRHDPMLPRKLLAAELGVSERQVRKTLDFLRENGVIARQGADRGGLWVITQIIGKKGYAADTFMGTVRESSQESSQGSSQKDVDETAGKILQLLKNYPSITGEAIAEKLGISRRAVTKHIGVLRAKGIVRRIGPKKGGYWEMIDGNALAARCTTDGSPRRTGCQPVHSPNGQAARCTTPSRTGCQPVQEQEKNLKGTKR